MRLSLFIHLHFYFSPAQKTCWDKVRLQNITLVFVCLCRFIHVIRAPDDGFVLSMLKTLFRLSRVLSDF